MKDGIDMTASDLIAAVRARMEAAEMRIRPWIRTTPTEVSPVFSRRAGTTIVLKLEHIQHSGSFKVRGAFSKALANIDDDRPLLTASSGNHGLAVAHVAGALGRPAEILVPETIAPFKYDLLRATSARVLKRGRTGYETLAAVRERAAKGTHLYLPPYNDLDVLAGQTTLGAELMRQDPEIDAIVASSGGGGLVCGVAIGAKAVKPDVAVIGASARNAQSFYRSQAAGHYVKTAERPTLSDGTSNALEPGSMTIPIGAAVLDETILIGEEAIAQTMKRFARGERWMIEGSAALSLAAAERIGKTGRFKRIAVIICGRSVDPAKLV